MAARISPRQLILGLYLGIAAFLTAHGVNAYVAYTLLTVPPATAPATEPLSPSASAPADGDALARTILSSGLFVVPAGAGRLNPDAEEAAPAAPPPIELAGKLKLLGTALGGRGRPAAVLEYLSDHKQRLYFLQETVEGFGQLAVIAREGITIQQGNRSGYLPLADPAEKAIPISVVPPGPRKAAAAMMIDRRQLQQSLSDVSKLLTEARAMPYYDLANNGVLAGWQLIDIKPKSILDQLGVQQRDVMLRINGIPVTDPGTMLRLLQQIQNEKMAKVDLIRDGQKQTLAYEIR